MRTVLINSYRVRGAPIPGIPDLVSTRRDVSDRMGSYVPTVGTILELPGGDEFTVDNVTFNLDAQTVFLSAEIETLDSLTELGKHVDWDLRHGWEKYE